MISQQQFYIYKFSSNRIKKSNYDINININDARKNGELITINQNQVIMSLFNLQGRKFDKDCINNLFLEKRKIKNRSASFENYQKILEIENKINEILFVPEIVSVVMTKKNQYNDLIKNSFYINNYKYSRLLCGAGHARHNTVIFVREDYEKSLKEILNNGHKDIEMIPAKFNAYFALSFSGIVPVSEPYFCVVPDYEIQRTERVDYIEEYNRKIDVKEIDKLLNFNIFDGEGLISPRLAKIWAKDLGIDDYIPSAFIIRNSFLKGCVCTFDFHKFIDESGKHITKDVWGNPVNLRDMDLIISASQFKMWMAYNSIDDYINNCKKNNMVWGISRVSPKQDNSFVHANYQFLQVLNLNQSQIENLCKKTVDYFNSILRDNINYVLLYLLGEKSNKEFDKDIFLKINDTVTKALILNNKLIKDPYIQSHLFYSLNKKIKESYFGNLLLNGNYTIIVIDPFAFMENLLGLPVHGLLNNNEYYCNFWNKKNINKVASMRAPLTWRSEVNCLSLINNDKTEEWYKYLKNGVVIYNIHGCDMMIHSDGDADGDIVMLTDQKEFIDGAYGGYPIFYEKKVAQKIKIIDSELYKIDSLSFDSRIGYITNCSTTMYSMLPLFDENSNEYKELINRLKICRRLQGDQIDLAKGINIKPFPKHWTKWENVKKAKDNEDLQRIEFNNKLVIDKRPFFMKFLYFYKGRKYRQYNQRFDRKSISKTGISIDVLLDKYKNNFSECNDVEISIAKEYFKFNPLLDSNCIINNICHYLENSVKLLKYSLRHEITDENIRILKDIDFTPIDKKKYQDLFNLYVQYRSEKRNFRYIKDDKGNSIYNTIEQYNKYIRNKAYDISSNINELATLAVAICYEKDRKPNESKAFLWEVFGEGVINNIIKNKQEKCFAPFLDNDGNIEFLGRRYKRYYNINIKNNELDELYV